MTRARAQASALVGRLEALGATVVELSVIEVAGPADEGAALRSAADDLVAGVYGWVVVTSANAASRLALALGRRPVPATTRWAAVGPATARALDEVGHPPDLVPTEARSEALADAFPPASGPPESAARRVLFPRAETVHGDLAAGLRAIGYGVDEVVAYRTVAGEPDAVAVEAARRADAVAFTSSSTVERTVSLLRRAGVPPVVASIGPATSATARAAGLAVTAEASEHTLDGLVEALVAALGR